MNRILLLEDDISLVDGLVYSLKKNEFDVEVARTVSEACLLYTSCNSRSSWRSNEYIRRSGQGQLVSLWGRPHVPL